MFGDLLFDIINVVHWLYPLLKILFCLSTFFITILLFDVAFNSLLILLVLELDRFGTAGLRQFTKRILRRSIGTTNAWNFHAITIISVCINLIILFLV